MVTEEEWHGEMAKARRLRFISPLAGLVVLGLLTVPAVAAGKAVGAGLTAYLTTAGVLIAIMLPLVYVLVIISDRQQNKTDQKVRERLLRVIADWDNRANQFAQQEASGRQPRMNAQAARDRAAEFDSRLQRSEEELAGPDRALPRRAGHSHGPAEQRKRGRQRPDAQAWAA